MLHLILGKSGSGKTTRALNILGELRQKGDTKLLMLVPDQNSFETETAFLNLLGADKSRDVLVFGFKRLCDYVFKNSGNIPENVIDDGVRKIIMRRALDECVDNLSFFSSVKTRKSVLDLMLHSLKEWKKDNITLDMIDSVKDKITSESLRHKLEETSLTLSAYDALLAQTYIDPLDDLTRLNNILESSDFFDGYTVVVDSFSGFTYQQLTVISTLMKRSREFFVTLNLDVERKDSEIFATTYRTYRQLRRISKRGGIELDSDTVLEKSFRTEIPELVAVGDRVLGINDFVYDKSADAIETYEASDVYNEAEFVARSVMSLVCDRGYKFSDIAVISREIAPYSGILDTAFEKFDIPYFMSVPKDIFTKPLVRFICSALEFLCFGFERESLLSMLKSGLSGLDEIEISELENYLFIWNIDRSALKKEFKNNPSGFGEMTKFDEEALVKLENTRSRVITPLLDFLESSKNAKASDITKALYKLLTDYNVDNSVDILYDKLEAQGLIFEANEEIRVYNHVMEALDKMVATVGDDVIELKDYKEYLEFLFSDIKFSDIPRYQDQVEVGVADSIRLEDVKAVFIIGAVDGVFPSVPKTAGVFSESERKLLIENDIPLTDNLEDIAAHEKYLAYCALTSPSEKLYVSYFVSDFSGQSYKPSVIYTDIERIFPERIHSAYLDNNEAEKLFNEQQAFEFLAENYNGKSGVIHSLTEYFDSSAEYKSDLERLESAVNRRPFRIENRDTAEKLFGKKIRISASQLEKYKLCAFQYFCNYGLRARERQVAKIDPIQFGNVVHYALENFLRLRNKETLNKLSEGEIRTDVDRILNEYADLNFGGLEDKEKSFIHLFARLKENIVVLINHLIRQLSRSDFIPVDFELGIGTDIPPYTVDIDGERSVSVNGFIDRVDVCMKNEDEYYVRIVDYKTGKKTFNLYEILYGINMQMLIYLSAVAKNGEGYYGKKLSPAGILYMPATAPTVSGDVSDVNREFSNKLKMNGLILRDEEVLNHMDKSGDYIKLSKKTLNSEYSDTVASEAQFADIFRHIDNTIREMGESLLGGKVEASPLKGIENGCAYCPYDSVCLRKYGDSYRWGEKKNAKEVYDSIKEGKGDE